MNIYFSPEAIEAARNAFIREGVYEPSLSSIEAALTAAIQHIVENPRELSQANRDGLYKAYHNKGWSDVYSAALRLAFTPPTPQVPEKIVEIVDRHFSGATLNGRVGFDKALAAATEAYEAGMAVSK